MIKQPDGLKPGVYPFLSMEEYHNDPAIGSSGIKEIIKSPLRYWANSPLNPDRPKNEKTPSESLGTAYHTLILEPEKWNYKIKEKVKSTSVEGFIGEGDYKKLQEMKSALESNPRHKEVLSGGKSECSIFWRDRQTGIMCKIRVDMFAPEWVSDLKTCSSVDSKDLFWDFPRYGYDISGAMYSEGMQNLKLMISTGYKMPPEFSQEFVDRFMAREKQIFSFVFQEKEYPYLTRAWLMSPYVTEIGLDKFRKGLEIYQECTMTGKWDAGWPDFEDIDESMVSDRIQG